MFVSGISKTALASCHCHVRIPKRNPDPVRNSIGIIRLTGKNVAYHVVEIIQRKAVKVSIKAGLIPSLAKRSTILDIWMPLECIALVRVCAHMIAVTDHLEIAVLFHNPRALLAHKGFENAGRIFIMVVRRKNVADVVQQRRNQSIRTRPVTPSPCGRPKRMAQPRDLID